MSLTSRFTRSDAPRRVTRSRAIQRCGACLMGVAIAAATLTATSAPAAAEPLIPANLLGALSIPFDAELAGAVRLLKAAGVDQIAVQAAQTIMGSAGQLSVEDIAGRAGALPLPAAAEGAPASAATPVAAPTDPIALLRTLGIQTLTPSVSPFCTAPTADNPLGLVTAGAGAVAGPWPMKTDPLTQLKPLLDMIPGVKLPEKLNLVEKGETAYAFVPASPTAGSGGTMQVAWFNTSTLQGGFADLDPITDRTALTALPLLSGVRLAPVKTGSGTILSAVFGNASNGTQNCWFLPAVGIVNA
ncbi:MULTISPECIES: hypothetical protein [Gordonia]|uniref:Secreted protein n=1 Tax=Gordonia hongkongensis TaxID=1701090 RepID=A0ABT6BUE6_9ACTN|nr:MULTISPECIES: hypothetical protein [Gordonia]OCW86185.1 hypothetical protein A8M60_22455 [Nocardia farcinica]MBN0971899.1 hypothetical protein [Gordonia sp. BP-119]MBN0984578.1 hypothetical protein [Gordonia sp. BP-94]MDF6101543.1 hypothetical protein [Gordonia hongkongensis]WGJ84410.1 hypothetical protein QAD21_16730 [Gordonia sp. SMJS1]